MENASPCSAAESLDFLQDEDDSENSFASNEPLDQPLRGAVSIIFEAH
jgi:hypothetical protein